MPAKTTAKPKPLGALRPGVIDLNDLVEIEDRFGALDTVDWTQLRVLRTLLWLAHRHDDPTLTIEVVGARYDYDSLQSAAKQVVTSAGLAAEPGEAPAAPAA
jgi:hypothetical protein